MINLTPVNMATNRCVRMSLTLGVMGSTTARRLNLGWPASWQRTTTLMMAPRSLTPSPATTTPVRVSLLITSVSSWIRLHVCLFPCSLLIMFHSSLVHLHVCLYTSSLLIISFFISPSSVVIGYCFLLGWEINPYFFFCWPINVPVYVPFIYFFNLFCPTLFSLSECSTS